LVEAGSNKKPYNPIGRYLMYAIGEIFLVVIGILIALHLPAHEATTEQAGINN
jgi:hypothetical protein